jgi:hypothetical protein
MEHTSYVLDIGKRIYDAEKGQVMNSHQADWSGGNALDLYSGGAQFGSRPRHRLFLIKFLIASRKIMDSFSNRP